MSSINASLQSLLNNLAQTDPATSQSLTQTLLSSPVLLAQAEQEGLLTAIVVSK